MKDERYTIGELAKLSGVSVRRIRFYSDTGLLPPATRTYSNYRVYSADDVARLDLIRALRDIGLGLAVIRKILSRRLSLTDVLTMRLRALEAEIASQRRVAAVLRATLKTPDPTETDLRRLWTVTTLSNAQFRLLVERFYDEVAGGAQMADAWKRQMIEASTPELPDDPTPRQIDAWAELTAIITDESYMVEMRANTSAMWTDAFDPTAYAEAANRILAKVRAAMEDGATPDSARGAAIAQEWLEGSASAMKRTPDQAFLEWHLDQYRKHHARSIRYQQLLAILRGDDTGSPTGSEWHWINEAMGPLLAHPE